MFRNDYNALSLNAINQLKLNFAKMEKRSHHTFYFEYKNMHQFDHQRSLQFRHFELNRGRIALWVSYKIPGRPYAPSFFPPSKRW